ncbi:flap endonuclease [Carbonactinospora thermoautotrophica]|uniref:5'-3' exonuclease n=1 Tax=Carbonactinospora thermoautotrophica TaxID=1469144 RepID=UPI0022717C6B|nr:5'-3' exonuclease [Carbonactinospora thermoautotrophica]MCX9192168.1 flap endonuclease [Carbonactinospora thermoautotrophica]
MLLDTPSLYFRAFYGVPESLTAPDGTPVNAVRGLLDFTARLVTDHRPTHLVACLDADWRPAFRVAAFPQYKAHRVAEDGREQVPAGLLAQIPVIEQVLDAFGIACCGVPGYEADDVIGTLCARARMPVDVVTGDRDLLQLVDDTRGVRLLYTARGVGRHEVIDDAELIRRYGVPGRAYADFALLRGDPSDGLPGVPGVGEKTAASLLSRYGSLEGLLAALDDPASGLGPNLRRKLEAARPYLDTVSPVVRVARDAPVPADLDARLPREPRHPERLAELAERWALSGPVNRLAKALAAG